MRRSWQHSVRFRLQSLILGVCARKMARLRQIAGSREVFTDGESEFRMVRNMEIP